MITWLLCGTSARESLSTSSTVTLIPSSPCLSTGNFLYKEIISVIQTLFRNGSLLATTCKDKKLRILDPRSGKLIQEGQSHPGTKASKVVYLGASGKLFTTGFSKFSDRQFGIWSEKDLSEPLKMENIDSSSGNDKPGPITTSGYNCRNPDSLP